MRLEGLNEAWGEDLLAKLKGEDVLNILFLFFTY